MITGRLFPSAGLPPELPSALALGIVSQVGQVVLLRELLMVFYGSEFSIGVILASWMAWVGAGSRLGGFLASRIRRPDLAFKLTAAVLLLVLPATIFLTRVLRGFFQVLPGEYLSLPATVWSCVLLMGPACLMLGVQFVLLSRIWRERAGVGDARAAAALWDGATAGTTGDADAAVRAGASTGATADATVGATGTYVFEAAGSAVGGVLFSLVLVHFLNSFQVAALVGILMLAAAFWMVRAPGIGHSPTRTAALVVALAATFFGLGALDEWAYRLQWKTLAPDQTLVETRQSRYGTISAVERGGQYSFFQSGHLAFSAASGEEEDFELEESAAAVFAHFAMVQHPNPRRVLLLGGGLRGVLREMARHPVDEIDYVELDPALVELARKYVPPATLEVLESPRVRVLTMDGRLFLHAPQRPYDMVVVDMPDPSTAVLNRFYTVEFFREVSGLLKPDGILVTGIGSTADLRSPAVANRTATVYHTLRSVFSHVLAVGDSFSFLFASRIPGQFSADPGELRHRYRERGVQARGFSEGYFFTLLQNAPLRRLNWILRHHGRRPGAHLAPPETGPLFPPSLQEQEAEEELLAPVESRHFINSDVRPIGYYYTVVLWHTLTRPGQARVFDWLSRVELWWALPPVGGILALQLLLRLAGHCTGIRPHASSLGGPSVGSRAKARFALGTQPTLSRADARLALVGAMLTTGFSTMVLQIALLFSFQSVYGFVYEMVGLIVALFMAGLAAGAGLAHRWTGGRGSRGALAVVQLLVASYAVVVAAGLPLAAGLGSSWVTFLLFSALTFGGGLLNGAGFPLAVSCCMVLGEPPERGAGMVYGYELVGGCLGAALAGVVVAPVLGVVACCLLAGIMNAAAFALILLSRGASWQDTTAERESLA
jgi:spermidine synthase